MHTWLLAAAAILAAGAPSADSADLVGYGQIGLSIQHDAGGGGAAIFSCENARLADQLLSKLQADLCWDKLLGPHTGQLRSGVPALQLGNGEWLALASRGERVYAASAATSDELEGRLKRLGLDASTARFAPSARHPMAWDFFDLRPLSFYQLPLNVLGLAKGLHRYDRQVLAVPADFGQKLGFGYSQFGPYFGLDELADGATHFTASNYSIGLAAARDQVYMTHTGMHLAPWWMRNRLPADIVQWDPYALTGWGALGAMGGTHLSQWATPDAYAYSQRFTSEALANLRSAVGDRLGCFRVTGGGHPGDEMGMHHQSTEYMDYDEAGQAAFRRWLRDERKLNLAGLGMRWHGDAARYRDWDEVHIPSNFEFFGGFGDGTFDLLTDWRWRPDSEAAEAEGWPTMDYRPGDEWTPTDLAPSMRQLFLFGSERDRQLRQGQSTVAWFRKDFDASRWLAQHPNQQVYLVAQVGDKRTQPVEVFMNGHYLGPIRPKNVGYGPIAFRATDLVRPGRNVICLKVANGLIRGPVFLTTQQPKRYPYLGVQANARWVDLRDWTAVKLIEGWKREARAGRQELPDIPLLFCPGGYFGFADRFAGLKRELGIASLHFTGGGSSYMPWWSGLGYVWGAYMTSEEGGTISDPAGLTRELAWMLLNGHGHHNFYYSAIDYLQVDQQTGWFAKNRRLFELMGKSTWLPPRIAVLRSAAGERYFPGSEAQRQADIGLDALPAAHHPNVYVTEAEIDEDLAAHYPLVFDTGTQVFDDAFLTRLERYVRAGGTFVATDETGRHKLLEPDAWPIARLTGHRVKGLRESAKLTVLPNNRLLPQLGGRSLIADGLALEATDAATDESAIIARWHDGSPAVIARKLGRGQIVVLGSNFWRSGLGRTLDGSQLPQSVQNIVLDDLPRACGAERSVDIDSEDVWVRRNVTKNGLQQWVMAYNAGRAAVADRTLVFPVARSPQRVFDLVSGKAVEFRCSGGMVQIPHLAIQPNEIRLFGFDGNDGLQAMTEWFSQKRRFEARATAPIKAEILPKPPATAVAIDQFRFRHLTSHDANQRAWLDEPTNGAGWSTIGESFWDESGYPALGVGLYRQSFRIPGNWRGRRILLAFVSFDTPVFLEKAEVFVNRQAIGEYRGHGWSNFDVWDVTGHVKADENALAVRVTAAEVRGAYLGQVVFFPLEKLEDVRELTTDWRLYRDNQHYVAASLPSKAAGRYLETRVRLPAQWNPKRIFLEFDVEERWVGCVVVNGRAIAFNQSCHPFGNIAQVNLYPWAKPGDEVCIELWPRDPASMAKTKMPLLAARIGLGAEPPPSPTAPPSRPEPSK